MDDPLAVSYRRHFDDVYRFVRRRATSTEAEDLTQEVFAAAAEALADARVEAPAPLAWLYTVARRRLVDLARRRVSGITVGGQPAGRRANLTNAP
jgi:RNA polymerase sigma factor (sigma-70 family)